MGISTSMPSRAQMSSKLLMSKFGMWRFKRASHWESWRSRRSVYPRGVSVCLCLSS